MKLLVKTVASTAVVLVALAGCASRSSGGNSAAAGPGSEASTTSSSAGAPASTSSGLQPSTPGADAPTSASGGQPTSASGSQPGSSPSGAAGSTTPTKPDPSAQVKFTSPQGVALAKDGITLVTEVEWGGCIDQPQLVVMSQDASKVVVELKTTNHARVGVMCSDIARRGEASVKLAAPLGSRQVIDGIKGVPITTH